MKHIFIVNPTSAKGKAITIANAIKECCEQEKLDYQIIYTKRPKEAKEIARDFNDDSKNVIYSVGGDGTLFEVVNGLMRGEKALFSVIPAGSGNDFYRTIKDQKEPFLNVDVGKVDDYYFINSASIGLDAEVANNISKMKKLHIPSSMIYKTSIIYSYLQYQSKNITTILNDTINTEPVTLCAICNGKYYGGGFPIAPNAQINDGKFDIYKFDKLSKLQIPGMLSKLIKGSHEEASCVHHYQENTFFIYSEENLVCNLDGEIIKDHSFLFTMAPQKLTLYEGHPAIKRLVKEHIYK